MPEPIPLLCVISKLYNLSHVCVCSVALCNCRLPSYGIFQARILKWVAIFSSGQEEKMHRLLYNLVMGTEKAMAPHSSTLAQKIPWTEEPGRLQSMGSRRVGHDLSDFTFTFHFHALEKEMATHSSVLAWRIPGTGKPGGQPSTGSHRVGHD